MEQPDDQQQPNTQAERSTTGTIGSFVWDLLKILIVALVIIIPFRLFVAEPFVVSGSSMVPTFHNADYLIVDRLSYRFHAPQRGDVIVFHFPLDTRQFFIKRIIGLPGDTVSFSQGHVVITNQAYPSGWDVPEAYLPNQAETFDAENRPVSLGDGQYFVLGDNRTGSSDSRVWGILPQNDIVGKVWLRVVPLSNFGKISTPHYQ